MSMIGSSTCAPRSARPETVRKSRREYSIGRVFCLKVHVAPDFYAEAEADSLSGGGGGDERVWLAKLSRESRLAAGRAEGIERIPTALTRGRAQDVLHA